MATYDFTFPASAAGKSVSITNSSDVEVDTATAGSASFPNGPIVVTKVLPVGDYVATATDAGIFYSSRAKGVLNVGASLTTEGARVAAFVDDADNTDAASVALAVDALRDALIAAGLMASE